MAPSKADRSHISSVTRNFLARLKKAAGPLDALTAITCLGLAAASSVLCDADSEGRSRLVEGDDGLRPPLTCSSSDSSP